MPYEVIRNVRIAQPCPVSWDEMKGDDRSRYCRQCGHNVYNFTGMSQVEVAEHLKQSEGRVCGRFYRRADGTLMTRNCPSGEKEANARRWPVMALALLVFSAFGAAATRFDSTANHVKMPNPMIEKARTTPVVGIVVNWIWPAPEIVAGQIIVGP